MIRPLLTKNQEKMKETWYLINCLVLCILLNVSVKGDYTSGSVYMKNGAATFKSGEMDKGASAYGFYNNTLFTSGWGVLEIRSGYGPQTKNNDIMFAAGYLEGVFTAQQMWYHYQNMMPFFFPKQDGTKEKVQDFLKQQDSWARQMISKNPQDKFWRQVSYVLSHLDGLYDGYKSVAKLHKDWSQDVFVVWMLNAIGDLIDLRHVVSPSSQPNYDNMSKDELFTLIKLQGHCSALVKTTGAFEDVFMSHSSWFIYSATNRIYKHYHFNIDDVGTAAKDMSFSSYPGFLESLDDFYLLGSGMVLLQTTNNIFNMSLYKTVVPESLLAWQRVRVANAMANSGKEWADAFAVKNSGTYNNQYMIIDLKKITLETDILDDALWVVEQIPTLVEAGDQTEIPRTGYWPSYNVPFYEKIYNTSGYPEFVAAHGLDYSYQMAPRAKIFRRDQGGVHDMKSMQGIMRYNDYTHDPYSDGNACSTICCRGDLNDNNPKADGCYDTKVTDFSMALKMQALVINGPTLGSGLKPFSWTETFANMSHVGLPDSYAFGWYLMEPVL